MREGLMRDRQEMHHTSPRKTLALVLAGGDGTRLLGLTRSRAKPAVPFGSRYRIVDFTLSNCVNSRLGRVALLTQYQPESLISHVERNWQAHEVGLATSIEIWPAHQSRSRRWYAGTADAVYQNRDRIEALAPDDILVTASDHVYALDYSGMHAAHVRSGADVTICCVQVSASESHAFGIAEISDDLRIRTFIEKSDWPAVGSAYKQSGTAIASMGVYLFNPDYLLECLEADAADPDSKHDFGYSLMPRIMADADVYAYLFRDRDGRPGYWRDVGTIDSYWAAHQELLASRLDPESASWPILGACPSPAPARLTSTADVIGSILGPGCFVSGMVTDSVLATGCCIDEDSLVSNSVLLPNATVGRNCMLDRVIVDSRCHIPDNTAIHADAAQCVDRFHVSPRGVVLVTEDMLELYESAPNRRIA
jgi:glucose-1-phosphate adenylyltransferase